MINSRAPPELVSQVSPVWRPSESYEYVICRPLASVVPITWPSASYAVVASTPPEAFTDGEVTEV